jgi:hypothetical protein
MFSNFLCVRLDFETCICNLVFALSFRKIGVIKVKHLFSLKHDNISSQQPGNEITTFFQKCSKGYVRCSAALIGLDSVEAEALEKK